MYHCPLKHKPAGVPDVEEQFAALASILQLVVEVIDGITAVILPAEYMSGAKKTASNNQNACKIGIEAQIISC
jgi:hypothetical protein